MAAWDGRTIGVERDGARTSRAAPSAQRPASVTRETASFVELEHDQLYVVTHAALGRPRGSVLLCGPVGIERERAYLTMVTWARILAARGFEVVRFDYRGTGESTGAFEDMTIAAWRDDAACCARRLAAATGGGLLLIQGVRLGAIIAAELFAAGIGDGLLLWAAPDSAQALLRETLRNNLVAQSMGDSSLRPRLRDELISALRSGERINVDGYLWTTALWDDAERRVLLRPRASETRPWHALEPRSAAVGPSRGPGLPEPEAVDADTFWNSSSQLLVPRSEALFEASLHWLATNEPWQSRSA